jgi:hypothetical protein
VILMQEPPMYEDAFKHQKGIEVTQTIAKLGGIAKFSDIESNCQVKGSTLIYHINRLIQSNVLKSLAKGTYGLRFKTPMSYLFGTDTPIAYVGLLGRRNNRSIPVTDVAVKLLEIEKHPVQLKYVVSTPDALQEWSPLKPDCQWLLCYEDEIFDIDSIKNKVRPQLEALLKDNIVILDCTSATKPASIAFYELAQEYLIPLIYVYENNQSIKWLISKDSIIKKLRMKKYS